MSEELETAGTAALRFSASRTSGPDSSQQSRISNRSFGKKNNKTFIKVYNPHTEYLFIYVLSYLCTYETKTCIKTAKVFIVSVFY